MVVPDHDNALALADPGEGATARGADRLLIRTASKEALAASGLNPEGAVGAALRGRPSVGRPSIAGGRYPPRFRDFRRTPLDGGPQSSSRRQEWNWPAWLVETDA
jgi:hypothetical protein